MSEKRTSKSIWFLDMALRCAHQGTCTIRNYGAVLVNPKTFQIISTGYTGSPVKTKHCSELGECWRRKLKVPAGTCYEKCASVHAEQNALLQAGREAAGTVLFLAAYDVETGKEIVPLPCFLCTKMLLNAGVRDLSIRRQETNSWPKLIDIGHENPRELCTVSVSFLHSRWFQKITMGT